MQDSNEDDEFSTSLLIASMTAIPEKIYVAKTIVTNLFLQHLT